MDKIEQAIDVMVEDEQKEPLKKIELWPMFDRRRRLTTMTQLHDLFFDAAGAIDVAKLVGLVPELLKGLWTITSLVSQDGLVDFIVAEKWNHPVDINADPVQDTPFRVRYTRRIDALIVDGRNQSFEIVSRVLFK